MREALEDKIKHLNNLMNEFGPEKTFDLPSLFSQIQKTVTKKYSQNRGLLTTSVDQMVGFHYPQCFVCKQNFIQCTHLCSSCRVTFEKMGNAPKPCPACNKGNHILHPDSPHLVNFLFLIFFFLSQYQFMVFFKM